MNNEPIIEQRKPGASWSRLGLSCLILLCAACLVLSLAAIVITGGILLGQNTQPGSSQTPGPLPTLLPSNEKKLPSDLASSMDLIQRQVLGLRGLPQKTDIKRDLLTTTQLRQRVETDFFDEYSREDAKNDERLMAVLGLLEPDFNLYDFYLKLYAEQVAGFYDPKTKEMFVVKGDAFNGPERMTYAHEFTHALQDQNYDLRNGLKINQKDCKSNSEYCSAVQALTEGDAVVSEEAWFGTYATDEDRAQVQEFAGTYQSPVYDSSPAYLKESFLFPYQQGMLFVQARHDVAGWAGVDEMYHNPPVSTEQILHPERYPNEKPLPVTLPALAAALGGDWKETIKDSLGEYYTYLVLAKGWNEKYQLPAAAAHKAAAGWGGDQYVALWSEKKQATVLAWLSDWDEQKEADEFWNALSDYGKKRWGKPNQSSSTVQRWQTAEGQVAFLRQGKQVVWLAAPDAETLAACEQAVNFGAP